MSQISIFENNRMKVAFMFKNRWRHIYSLEERICKENLIKEFKPNLLKKSN